MHPDPKHADPTRIVEAGYDLVAERYLAWSGRIRDDPRQVYLRELVARLPANPAVLDLGCGAGIPSTAALARYGDVLGVDLSRSQIELAQPRRFDQPSADHRCRVHVVGR